MALETKGRKPIRKRGHVSTTDLRNLAEQQDYKCWLTGVELTPRLSSLDHKKARSNGGEHDIENLCILHPVINAAKGSLNVEQFVHICHLVASKHADTGDKSWWEMAPQAYQDRPGP